MSRLRVLGLPTRVTQQSLREHFAGCGEITDCVILRRDGRPRMAFIGLKRKNSATDALRTMNGTYMGSSKLTVQRALPVGDPRLGRAGGRDSRVNDGKFTSEKKKRMLSEGGGEAGGRDGEEEEGQRLYVWNLPPCADESDLERLFLPHGRLSQIHLVRDKDTRESRGLAFVSYERGEDARRAVGALDGNDFQGRLLKVSNARPRPGARPAVPRKGAAARPETEYRQRKRRRQELLRDDPTTWNSLFLRDDTVVDTVAKRVGVSKGELLNPELEGAAARVALGEAVLANEAKDALCGTVLRLSWMDRYMLTQGVDWSALQRAGGGMKRSRRVIVVKNIRSGDQVELTAMFKRYGEVRRIVCPPDVTIAAVEFVESSCAKAAFRGLAFFHHNGVPLYLEWAPLGFLKGAATDRAGRGATIPAEGDGEDLEGNCTLLVRNLPAGCTDKDLKGVSSNASELGLRSIVVREKKKIAFIEFRTHEGAVKAFHDYHRFKLRGSELQVSFAQGKKRDVKPLKRGGTRSCPPGKDPTRLVIKNVPFQATREEIRKLLSAYSAVKAVRLPKRHHRYDADGARHRGFAFVEFETAHDATVALQSLSHTHLYGRHLVFEHAQLGSTMPDGVDRS